MDKSSILANASSYVKELEQRVRELEQEVESSNMEVNSNEYCCGPNEIVPEIKVRALQNDVLIIIHCEKQKGIMLKILSHLENLHLSVVNSSVLRFGKSTLDITIIAQMGDGYNLTLDQLVKTIRLAIFSH
ncbi:hypothetical protein VNO78_24604 [Psophocarpus tetragonolobus]|uniref:Plant bHLH transcription factor ACT-like domain-containing protein n=1 Tax=Psophocarpus tetragonolobus TaxID=3891 RepID=A0AAN9XEQ9_PSOTE